MRRLELFILWILLINGSICVVVGSTHHGLPAVVVGYLEICITGLLTELGFGERK